MFASGVHYGIILITQYLQTVIPYKLPKELKWRIDTLTQLTKGIHDYACVALIVNQMLCLCSIEGNC